MVLRDDVGVMATSSAPRLFSAAPSSLPHYSRRVAASGGDPTAMGRRGGSRRGDCPRRHWAAASRAQGCDPDHAALAASSLASHMWVGFPHNAPNE